MMSLIRILRSSWWSFLSFVGDIFGIEIKDPIVFYYGCPNSDKAKKLQLKRKEVR